MHLDSQDFPLPAAPPEYLNLGIYAPGLPGYPATARATRHLRLGTDVYGFLGIPVAAAPPKYIRIGNVLEFQGFPAAARAKVP